MRFVDIRSTFLDFFTSRDHQFVPSSPLLTDDPTLLLTTAGMAPFKPYFLGTSPPPAPRLTSRQRCVRTVDIENIGRTDRHTTFFEMLGNFSFGDYGKDVLIPWAWEFLTERLGLDPGRIWATVYLDDDEAVAAWRAIGLPPERIQRLGPADNLWHMGGPGPCGPSSEVFYDRGAEFGGEGGPAVNTDRYIELWGLVFMRDVRGEGDGDDFPILGQLPRPCIDTGLGVDRTAVVLQDVPNVHEVDVVAPTMDLLAQLAGSDVRTDPSRRRSARIVVDHTRAATHLIADGVLASNEGAGYVLRRLVRRAVRHATLLGVNGPVLGELADSVVEHEGDGWPHLVDHRSLVTQALGHEEVVFERTLQQGARILESAISRTKHDTGTNDGGTNASDTNDSRTNDGGTNDSRSKGRPRRATLPGQTAFELHDTFGFPIDLTMEIAAEAGLDVDTDRFATLMDEQRRRAQRARAVSGGRMPASERSGGSGEFGALRARLGATVFVGHDTLATDSVVRGLVAAGVEVPEANEGSRVDVVLDMTPFYAEGGGQVGDTGRIQTDSGAELEVVDTTSVADGLQVHSAVVRTGVVRSGENVRASVDSERRAATERSHSATHVLHAVLRQTLGDHAQQRGSLVAPGRLRFDFSHFGALESDQLASVEETVNERLLADPDVRIWQASREEAQEAGAMALFGETYGSVVRVVDIGDFSRELCGGTHVAHGSQAGPVRLLGEGSVGSGLRRIEALTGLDALRHADHERRLLEEIGALVGAGRPAEIVTRLQGRLDSLARAERELATARQAELAALAARLAGRRRDNGTRWVVSERLASKEIRDPAELRTLAAGVLALGPPNRPGAVVLGLVRDDKAQVVLEINEPMDAAGLTARKLLATAGRTIGGGAGGSGRLGHAGGRDVAKLDAALAEAARAVIET